MLRRIIFFVLLLGTLKPISGIAEPDLLISDAVIMQAPPGISVTAGLMTIENTGNRDITISAILSDRFQKLEIHKTEINDGMASMVEYKELLVPAGEKIELKHGGYHLMLYAPTQALEPGERIKLRLQTDAGEISIEAEVKKISM